MKKDLKQVILNGEVTLGIELGSTRIKAVLIDPNYMPIASGSYDWENKLINGIWTYSIDDVWLGIQSAYANLAHEVKEKYDARLTKIASVGISAMMHGYLVFDKTDKQLTPFRTWRNTMTEQAAAILTETFQFNIPQRWCIAHLYQAILNEENHIKDISFITTLAGYVHWKLTGQKVLGVGDASGLFPIDSNTNDYHAKMCERFDAMIREKNFGWRFHEILPKVLEAGTPAGYLTPEGAKLLDVSEQLLHGIPLCPPEGDAGTGMVATNSVSERTGNVSAGTSIFTMVVLEKELSRLYTEIDMVTTPAGKPVAMVHCNSCTSDMDAWLKIFDEMIRATGTQVQKSALYDAFYQKAVEEGVDADAGGLVSYNYFSGEPITELEEGRPLFVRMPDSRFTLRNFARCILFSTMATLKIGMNILTEKENVQLEQLLGHGGLFKTRVVGQRLMASALDVPVSVMESAGEGGAWGIALLAAYMYQCSQESDDTMETLEKFLSEKVFGQNIGLRIEPNEIDRLGFAAFMKRYEKGLEIERAAVKNLTF